MENEEKKAAEKKPLTQKQKKQIAVFVTVLVVAALLIWLFLVGGGRNLDRVLRFTRFGGQSITIAYEPGSVALGESFGTGLATMNNTSLTIYDVNGSTTSTVAVKLSDPVLQAAESHLLAYDAGGTTLKLVNAKGETVLETEADGGIFDADVTPKGEVGLISAGSSAKTILKVYNKNQTEIYTVRSVTRYYSRCALRPGAGQVAVVALGQNESVFTSTLLLYDTGKEGVQAEVDLGNQLIFDVEYLSKNLICAIGEESLIFVNNKGSVQGTYEYDGDLVAMDYSSKGFAALVMRSAQGGGGWNLVTVNSKGKELGRVALAQEVTDLSVTGKYVAVLTPSALTLYSQKLDNWGEYVYVSGYSSVSVNADGSAFLVGNEESRRFVP